jgi:hypothetical protein
MANFTTRIELYGSPTGEDYEKLHAAMGKEGFKRTMKWEGDDTVYHLPNAEYNLGSDLSSEEVKDKAVKAAATVWKNFGVLTTKAAEGRAKHNLKKV